MSGKSTKSLTFRESPGETQRTRFPLYSTTPQFGKMIVEFAHSDDIAQIPGDVRKVNEFVDFPGESGRDAACAVSLVSNDVAIR